MPLPVVYRREDDDCPQYSRGSRFDCRSPLVIPVEAFDFAAMVPMQVETCLTTPETAEKFSRIKQVIIGGAALSPVLEERLQQVPTRCYSTYGMTETVSHVALRDINGVKKSPDYFALGDVHFEVPNHPRPAFASTNLYH